jgi:DNA-binding LacI/PurR family transcriptional regulator
LEEYLRLFVDRLVEGFVLVNTLLPESPTLPTVAISGHKPMAGTTNVIIDHDRAAFLALSHLTELGHERIAFFKGHKKSADTESRWQSILRAAKELKLEVRADLTLQLEGESMGSPFTPEQAYEEGHVFGRKLLERKVVFTALFAFNDISAIGAMKAFREAGLHVPNDISVVGFDDIQSAAFQNPGLTTVRQPLQEMGEIAARTLLARLSGETTAPEITVTPKLVIRESTGRVTEAARKRARTGQGVAVE